MNQNKTTSILKGLSLIGLTLSGLLFMNCSTQDVDTLPPYQSEKEFDKVEDLPDLNDPDPDGVDVEIGDVNDPPITDSIIEDISNANSEEELAELIGKLLERMGNTVDQMENLDPEILAFIQSLDVDSATRILKGEQEVSEKLKEFAANAGGGNNFAALLPQVVFPKINGKTLRTISEFNKEAASGRKTDKFKTTYGNTEHLRTTHWESSCEEAAQNAFDNRVGELELQKEDQLSTVSLNYKTRQSEIEVNNDLRMHQQEQIYNFQIDYLILNVSSVLQAASVINNPQLKNKFLLFVAVYIIQASQLVQNWNQLAEAAIEEAYEKELEIIEVHRDAMIEKVEAAFHKAVKFAEEILEKALENCHNQGSGS